MRPTGCFREAVNQQNPLKPGVRELPIPNRPGQRVRQGEGNRTDGRSLVMRVLTDSEVGEAVARLVERQRAIDGRALGTSGITRGQQPGKPARPGCRNPHGVESAPKADEERRWNLGTRPRFCPLGGRMAEATGDRAQRGRSLRSSPGAGKPSTWRRQAVGATCKQEMDICPTR